MRILVLGVGKTGKLVAQVAAERGHSVHVLDAKENKDAAALTPPFVAGFDAVIDFTTPEAVISNMRACLANGAKMVVGTTGWYDRLPRAKETAERKGASLLYEYGNGPLQGARIKSLEITGDRIEAEASTADGELGLAAVLGRRTAKVSILFDHRKDGQPEVRTLKRVKSFKQAIPICRG